MISKELLYEGQKSSIDYSMEAAVVFPTVHNSDKFDTGFQNLCPDLSEGFNYFRHLQEQFGQNPSLQTS